MMTQIQITIALIYCICLMAFVQGATIPAAGESATTINGTTGVGSNTTVSLTEVTITTNTTATTPAPKYCHHTVPCAWSIYDDDHVVIKYVKHPYCVCQPTTKCDYLGDDNWKDSTYVFQCRRPDGSYPADR